MITFTDGQNLFHASREAFGYAHPNFDIVRLSKAVCGAQGWDVEQVRFYTGVPDARDNEFWSAFWVNKLAMDGRRGAKVITRPVRYRTKVVTLPDGTKYRLRVGEEKGIDVRIAIDVIRLAHRGAFDVAVIFSQDQDLSEVAEEVREIAREHGRWIKIASAFPWSPEVRNPRGIDKTDWIRIDKDAYDACRDRRGYRPGPRGDVAR